ncbi:MAG: RsmD family RNA methyltransferase, partial [Deltaproteobacteria bacterium]
LGPMVKDARVLEPFAGTAAFGLEALSRGADSVVFEDQAREMTRALTRTVRSFGVEDAVLVLMIDAAAAVRKLGLMEQRFEIVFLDPPYETRLVSKVVSQPGFTDLIETGGLLIVERRAAGPEVGLPRGYRELFSRKYGGTAVEIYDRGGVDSPLERERDITPDERESRSTAGNI